MALVHTVEIITDQYYLTIATIEEQGISSIQIRESIETEHGVKPSEKDVHFTLSDEGLLELIETLQAAYHILSKE